MDDSSSRPAIAIDELFDGLAGTDRRAVVQYFRDRTVEAASLDDVAETLAAGDLWDEEEPGVRIQLHHCTLPELADAGIIDYDPRSETVRYRGHPDGESPIDVVDTRIEMRE